uniref:(northern house mosquito) hypothetical protein n=1 Tax=Culex pipiens TaxID=7175 RepID=A0A8D8MDI4_CULPI
MPAVRSKHHGNRYSTVQEGRRCGKLLQHHLWSARFTGKPLNAARRPEENLPNDHGNLRLPTPRGGHQVPVPLRPVFEGNASEFSDQAGGSCADGPQQSRLLRNGGIV